MDNNDFEIDEYSDQDKGRFGKVKSSKFFLPIVVLIIAVVVMMGFQATKPEVVEEKNEFPPLVVEVSAASFDEEIRSSSFQGEVRAKTDIELVSQVTGKVMSVSDKFIEGGQFVEGETILQIDDADYQVALKSAQAAVAEAKVQLDIEQASAETSKKEWQDLVGESLDKANPLRLNKPQVQRARARLDAATAQYAQAQLDYSRTKISAPFAGRIMSKKAELGQFVSRGSSIGRAFSTDSVEVRIPMSDTQISELGMMLGQVAQPKNRLKADVSARFGIRTHHWRGYLKSIDASVDNETRLLYGTVVVESPFDSSDPEQIPLAPGLYVNVTLDAAEKVAGVRIPRSALRNGSKVYVVEDDKLSFREVEPLFTSADVAVLNLDENSNLNPGDMVVITPVPGAFDGMAVEIKDALAGSSDPVDSSEPSLYVEPEQSLDTVPDEMDQQEPAEVSAEEEQDLTSI